MADIGLYHTLTVLEEHPHGLYLDDLDGGKILLPRKQIPANTQIGDALKVFLYLDSEDRIIATTLRPKVQLNQVAWLEAVDVNSTGAFLDWGLPKDLFVPFAEQTQRMEVGRSYAVYVYLDNSNRLTGSTRLGRFIKDEVKSPWPGAALPFAMGDKVKLLITQRTDMGYKAVINNSYWGVLHNDDVRTAIRVGQKIEGYIKRIRADQRVDLMLEPAGHVKADPVAGKILKKLSDSKGFLPMGDFSPADLIELQFAVSKRTFKMAIGKLYKERKIVITDKGLYLPEAAPEDAQKPSATKKTISANAKPNKVSNAPDTASDAAPKPSAKKWVVRNEKSKTSQTLSLKKKTISIKKRLSPLFYAAIR